MSHRDILRTVGWVSLGLLVTASPASAQSKVTLAPLQFLLGEWEGVGDQAGATGGFAFASSVQDRVIVRTNYSITPAKGSTPASRHDDVMVIYVDAGAIKADYIDSEDHVIRYSVEARPDAVVFVSEITPAEPRYRLRYTRTSAATLTGTFEIAPPGRPEAFGPYLSWTARKTK